MPRPPPTCASAAPPRAGAAPAPPAAASPGARRPARQKGILARDQILAWQLQFRDRGAAAASTGHFGRGGEAARAEADREGAADGPAEAGQKERRGRRGAPAPHDEESVRANDEVHETPVQDSGRRDAMANCADGLIALARGENRRFRTASPGAASDWPRGGIKDQGAECADSDREEQRRLRRRRREEMVVKARIERTAARAAHIKSRELRARAKEVSAAQYGSSAGGASNGSFPAGRMLFQVTLCPADDWRKGVSGRLLGPLQNSNLSISALATILHLKQLLISKLQHDLEVDDIVLACRGIVLRNDQSVYSVRQHIWPSSHPLPPVLRYRLRAEAGDRPSSLAHTGEPLSEPGPHDDASLPGPPFRCLDAMSLANDSSCEGPSSWMEQFPSDFVHYQNIVSRHGVETGTAVLPGVAAAAAADGHSCGFWMGEQTQMLPTPPRMLPLPAFAGMLNWSSPEAQLRHAFAAPPPYGPATRLQEGSAASSAFAGAAWNGFAGGDNPMRPSTSSCKLPSMEVRGRA